MEDLKRKADYIILQQQQLANMFSENDELLRRNLGLFEVTQTLFPIDSETKLLKLENDLSNDEQADRMGAIKRILCGSLKNIDRIMTRDLIVLYNLEGTQDKKSLKLYENFLNALYECVKKEGYTYVDFKKELRTIFRRIKNTHNKDRSRKEQKEFAEILKNIKY